MRTSASSAVRVPPASPGGATERSGVPPPEPLPRRVPRVSGVSYRVGGRTQPVLQRWYLSETLAVSTSPTLSLHLSILPSKPLKP
ncbi:hypothetical protein BVC80_633g30 [Macleaya cordata]|uniref:Uncharacterized protein n=1 Tax=Macleaya cordata TaxID=56857 RepID=A0A200QN07_MACCD|nr:hypothetical protein BVC80_633g30 [Macleaya cordata]